MSHDFRAPAQAASPLRTTSGEGSKLRTSQDSALDNTNRNVLYKRHSMATDEDAPSSSRSSAHQRSMQKASIRPSFIVKAVDIEKNCSLKTQPVFSRISRKFGSGLASNRPAPPHKAMN
jgi:hypothetical protein